MAGHVCWTFCKNGAWVNSFTWPEEAKSYADAEAQAWKWAASYPGEEITLERRVYLGFHKGYSEMTDRVVLQKRGERLAWKDAAGTVHRA